MRPLYGRVRSSDLGRIDRHVGALERTLQQAPEVLATVGVTCPCVSLGVVDDLVVAIGVHAGVRLQGVSVLPDWSAKRSRWSMNHADF